MKIIPLSTILSFLRSDKISKMSASEAAENVEHTYTIGETSVSSNSRDSLIKDISMRDFITEFNNVSKEEMQKKSTKNTEFIPLTLNNLDIGKTVRLRSCTSILMTIKSFSYDADGDDEAYSIDTVYFDKKELKSITLPIHCLEVLQETK